MMPMSPAPAALWLDVVCGYLLLFLLDIKIENRYNRCQMLDSPVISCRKMVIHLAVAIFLQVILQVLLTCDFTSFLTVFQSNQDDVWMIMKGCVRWNSVYG